MISSKSVSICNRFHARWVNSGKITISKGCTPLWCPRSRGISSPSGTKLPHTKLETPGYYTVRWRPGVSISPGLGSVPGRDTPDGQTDRIPIANTRSQQYLPVQLSRVKCTSFMRSTFYARQKAFGRFSRIAFCPEIRGGFCKLCVKWHFLFPISSLLRSFPWLWPGCDMHRFVAFFNPSHRLIHHFSFLFFAFCFFSFSGILMHLSQTLCLFLPVSFTGKVWRSFWYQTGARKLASVITTR